MADTSPFRNPRWQQLLFLALGSVALVALTSWTMHFHRKKTVDFSRDIRPILNQNCVSCHGGVRQKNGVSFIFRDEALGRGKSGHRTIVPGNPDASELMVRVLSHDSEGHMPYHGPMLSEQQIGLLRQWIKEGAQFDDYWAFVPPKPQQLPQVKETSWVRQPIDRFILARLEKEGLKPSPDADNAELLRRASLDITGLPPTPAEEAAFQADHSPNAYEKQVDRLLASPRYGERWASMWLDLARYADTMGYEKDGMRPGVWPYRDWVIDAYNANMPYDQFVIKQLAGDLLPNATMGDRIATSFHRLTPNNDEGGTDDEEFRLVAVMDRVATTWSVTSGITMNCVQCHSHPYDPIRHADYYKTMAFFNTQRDSDLTDDSPTMRVPKDKSRYAEASQLENEVRGLLRSVEEMDRTLEEKTQWKQLPIESTVADEVSAIEPMIPGMEKALETLKADKKNERIAGAKKVLEETKAELARAKAAGGPARTFTLRNGEAWANADTPARSFYQIIAKANVSQITALRISVPPINADTARHTPENGFIVSKVQAWVISPDGQKQPVSFSYFARDSEGNLEAAEREGEKPKPQPPASGANKTQSAKPKLKNISPPPKLSFAEKPPSLPDEIPSSFAATPKLFQTRWIVAVPVAPVSLAPGSHIEVDLKQTGSIDDKPAQIQRVRLDVSGDAAWTSAANAHRTKTDRLFAVDKRLSEIPSVPLPVMVEQQPYEQRATLEFDRGNFLTKSGPALSPDVPAIFPKFPKGVPRNRLTLAQWFFTPDQLLTARVAVNRYWEELFGTGIVETLENFGSVGEEPSHPELLDWLALHFQNDLHWNMKALVREIVTSAAYRQSAVVTPSLLSRDPRNRLLARGPQQRLTAEMVRDQALLASGLLSPAMGGPPVMPPQPLGIWNSVYSDAKWTDATGPDRYRRGVYTFIKRTAGYPSSLIFDASDRDTSLPRRIATNTPLQALVTLNDPVYQEAAQSLARRVVKDVAMSQNNRSGEDSLDTRLTYETRLVLSRPPTPAELAVLRKAYAQALTMSAPATLMKASMNAADNPFHQGANSREVAALTVVGSILFNLDAALVR